MYFWLLWLNCWWLGLVLGLLGCYGSLVSRVLLLLVMEIVYLYCGLLCYSGYIRDSLVLRGWFWLIVSVGGFAFRFWGLRFMGGLVVLLVVRLVCL